MNRVSVFVMQGDFHAKQLIYSILVTTWILQLVLRTAPGVPMICKKAHRHDPFFEPLPEDQCDPARHRCDGCAYEAGYNQGKRGERRIFSPENLPFSQAGYVRHRAAEEAFELGYSAGEQERLQKESV